MYTSHGHHIPGTIKDGVPENVARCGGPGLCDSCSRQAAAEQKMLSASNVHPHDLTFPKRALNAVKGVIDDLHEKTDPQIDWATEHSLYIVWFSKTLQNWKALISTTLPDGKYYEVTFNGDKHEIYVDVYVKMANVRIDEVGRVT